MRRLLLSSLLAAPLALAASNASATLIPLGATAPDLTRNDLTGTPRSISDYRGKVLVLFLLGYN